MGVFLTESFSSVPYYSIYRKNDNDFWNLNYSDVGEGRREPHSRTTWIQSSVPPASLPLQPSQIRAKGHHVSNLTFRKVLAFPTARPKLPGGFWSSRCASSRDIVIT